eukprot:scaffold232495_cov30-Cyclotella_meneghiniana.AAC.1
MRRVRVRSHASCSATFQGYSARIGHCSATFGLLQCHSCALQCHRWAWTGPLQKIPIFWLNFSREAKGYHHNCSATAGPKVPHLAYCSATLAYCSAISLTAVLTAVLRHCSSTAVFGYCSDTKMVCDGIFATISQ